MTQKNRRYAPFRVLGCQIPERMTSGVYEVCMSVKEKDVTLLEVKLSVPDAASAEAIAARWEEKNAGIYQYLIENLF